MRCIVVKCQLKSKRPKNKAYPNTLDTLGDHLRKVRLDRGLSQLDVAKILNVTQDTITGWENKRNQPTAKFAKSIIDFLGYLPFKNDDHSIGEQLYFARLVTGKTQKQVANLIGCDASNLRYIELGQRIPHDKTREKIQEYISMALNKVWVNLEYAP